MINYIPLSSYSKNIYSNNDHFYINGKPRVILADGQDSFIFCESFDGNTSGDVFTDVLETSGNRDFPISGIYITPAFDDYKSDVNVNLHWFETDQLGTLTGVSGTIELNLREDINNYSFPSFMSVIGGSVIDNGPIWIGYDPRIYATKLEKVGGFGDSTKRRTIYKINNQIVWSTNHLNKIIPFDKRDEARDFLGRSTDDNYIVDACQDDNSIYCVANKTKYSKVAISGNWDIEDNFCKEKFYPNTDISPVF